MDYLILAGWVLTLIIISVGWDRWTHSQSIKAKKVKNGVKTTPTKLKLIGSSTKKRTAKARNAGTLKTEINTLSISEITEREKNLKVSRAELKKSAEENNRLKATIKEWPEESRIDIISTNGNEGDHYERI